MKILKGNYLQASRPGVVLVAPTNGVVGARGLVMGAGATKALAEAEPWVPLADLVSGQSTPGAGLQL